MWNVDPSSEMALHSGRIVSHAGAPRNPDGGEAQRNGAGQGRGGVRRRREGGGVEERHKSAQ